MRRAAWSPESRRDLERIDDHYARLAPEYANAILRAAGLAAAFLAENPFAGPEFGDGKTRKWRVQKSPYLLIYRPRSWGVEIVRVRHSAEDWKPRI